MGGFGQFAVAARERTHELHRVLTSQALARQEKVVSAVYANPHTRACCEQMLLLMMSTDD
jgi:pantothenate synthetase